MSADPVPAPAQVCSVYKCGETELTDPECSKLAKAVTTPSPTANTFSLRPCTIKGNTCNYQTVTATTPVSCAVPVDSVTLKVDGEKCLSTQFCGLATTACPASLQCVGVADGSPCASAFECKVGSSCVALKCAPQSKTVCVTDVDCVNSMGCLNSVCTPYGSLANGVVTTNTLLCKSLYAIPVGTPTPQLTCVDIKISEANKSWECAPGSTSATTCTYDVTGSTAGLTTTQNCQCSLAIGDKMFCPRDTLSAPYAKAITDTIAKVANVGAVHTVRRYTSSKVDATSLLMQFPAYKDADKCLTQMALSSGWLQIGASLLAMILFL